ncbi:MAG: CDP-alcohol phosphatidyltransferase family protein [Deltaproteobacteria bacterium]|jgi:cardiolipin synthase (CMP-forming)|nr:CDP-alcohol phosphatidyltransferase family protein [Deltaproteobacteria bacterium]
MAVASPHKPAPRDTGAPTLRGLLNVPNFLTLCRVGSIPLFLSFLSRHQYTEALYVFVAAALTDALDGTVARWFNARTEIGAFLDPFADKLMLVSAFVVLTVEQDLPGWLLGVVVIRDVVVVGGYLMIAFFTSERMPVRPSYLGKLSTVLQLACVVATLLRMGVTWPSYWYALLYLTVGVTALSGVHYSYRGLVWLGSREPEMFT